MGKDENTIEKYFCEGIEKIGGLTRKFVSPGVNGVPDRIVLLPTAIVIFVEFKSETGTLSPGQKAEFKDYAELGHQVYVIESIKKANELLEFLRFIVTDRKSKHAKGL